jgi:hypothetical protein
MRSSGRTPHCWNDAVALGTTVPQSDLEELIAKARVHFNYAPSTRGLDIKRAVLTAFRRHLEKQPVDR